MDQDVGAALIQPALEQLVRPPLRRNPKMRPIRSSREDDE
jgi:hypothetical protein